MSLFLVPPLPPVLVPDRPPSPTSPTLTLINPSSSLHAQQRPSIPPMPPISNDRAHSAPSTIKRRSTLMFTLRRKSPQKQIPKAAQWKAPASESGHSHTEWLPPPHAAAPLHLDIPIHPHRHARKSSWNDGVVVPTLHSTSSSFDALAEFAWTGTASANAAFIIEEGTGWGSTWSLGEEYEKQARARGNRAKFTLGEPEPYYDSPVSSTADVTSGASQSKVRPSLVKSEAYSSTSAAPRRRWTLAMAMTDEGITDEVFVEELERMRLREDAGWEPSLGGSMEDGWIQVGEEDGEAQRSWDDTSDRKSRRVSLTPSLPTLPSYHPRPRITTSPASTTTSTSNASWQSARRALLTCRELVRTERHYLTSLQALLSGETTTTPPALMLRYIRELVGVSEALLGRMEEDPSAWGVSAAFLGAEEGVEGAFVGWCGVVGGWFTGRSDEHPCGKTGSTTPRRRLSKTRMDEESGDDGVPNISPLKRTVSTWRKSMPSIANMNGSSGGGPPMTSPVSTASFLGRRKERERLESPHSGHGRKLPVRDLAILPTQRVMRYVLLYRDLLLHTPSTSPSRALVERAVEAACRIAEKCDRAQGNSAFLQH